MSIAVPECLRSVDSRNELAKISRGSGFLEEPKKTHKVSHAAKELDGVSSGKPGGFIVDLARVGVVDIHIGEDVVSHGVREIVDASGISHRVTRAAFKL